MISNESNNKESLGVVFILKGNKGFLILDKAYYTDLLKFRDNARVLGTMQVYTPDHQILDTIKLNNLRDNTFIITRDCLEQGERNTSIVAMIEGDTNYREKESYSNIKRAWKINFQTNKLEEQTNIEEITCINDWYKRRDWYKNRRK